MKNYEDNIPKEWLGKKVEILVDNPHGAPYKKGDIVKVIPANEMIRILFGKEVLLQREGDDRPYSTSKDNVRLVEDSSELTQVKTFNIGDRVRILPNPNGAPANIEGTIVEPDPFAQLFGIPWLVKDDKGGTYAVDKVFVELVGETPSIKEGSIVRLLEDDDWGDFNKGQEVKVIFNKDYDEFGFMDNDNDFRSLNIVKHEVIS